jgi:hypothetical protein
MASKDDKWVMFRNYMTNELGITKEDIRTWIKDIIHDEVKNVVQQAYGRVNIESEIKNEIYSSGFYHRPDFKNEIKAMVAKELANRIEIYTKH